MHPFIPIHDQAGTYCFLYNNTWCRLYREGFVFCRRGVVFCCAVERIVLVVVCIHREYY